MKKDNTRCGNQTKKAVISVFTGAVSGIAVSMLIILVSVVIMVKTQSMVYTAVVPITVAAVLAGSFVGGYVSARLNRSLGLLIGAVCGAVIFLAFLGIGSMSGGSVSMVTLLRLGLDILSGAVGGVIGVNKKRRR